MTAVPPRRLSDEPFPSYAFIPGRYPHPVSDPAGHSFGRIHSAPAPLESVHWNESRDYLRGIDLFNFDYFWEAHEAWESLWHAAGRRGTIATFLKGMIKIAAAGVKHLEGKPAGVTSHASRAAELWREVEKALGEDEDSICGFRIPALIRLAEAVARDGWPETPIVLWPMNPGAASCGSNRK